MGVDTIRGVRYGLGTGSADLIACVRGRFVAIEVKAPGKKLRPEQEMWGNVVTESGGLYIMIDNEEEIPTLFNNFRNLRAAVWL